uniref:Acetyl-coenzyme A carboxylase carboxyl transferase subunit beta, chloroplastic n=1 Tax=Tylosema fassoglense TaxID=228518 RepID=A0A2S0SW11_9FABA|nr:acetyl-CoA carboxylase carboxyltransferase beta subunit [Tylosema fassoglense]AWB13125.1 acetyl-CoA carboxylase carboxyltransferase beta subunit [Tylosema fassoglense]
MTNTNNNNNLTIRESSNALNDLDDNNLEKNDLEENNLEKTHKYKHLWVQCEKCYGLNYKKWLKSQMNLCEYCGFHFKMTSLDRIELLIDPGTWNPMDEDMVSLDPIEWDSSEFDSSEFDSSKFDSSEFDLSEFDPRKIDADHFDLSEFDSSEEESYKDRIESYQTKTGLTEAVQTGTGEVNGLPVAIGVMDFHFLGGSMGSVVGEKITRLIEYASNHSLPLILVCASGGARMQEGSLSLMQMAKISSALYDFQIKKKLFYISILTSPTTGGVTASFGMLGDVVITEPEAYIAFAGKRVIEETLKKTVPEGSQESENLYQKGTFDFIVSRYFLKETVNMVLTMHFYRSKKNDFNEP